ncbi:MAG: XRE family transcriptional regulator [Eggerthellaceae bacterium]
MSEPQAEMQREPLTKDLLDEIVSSPSAEVVADKVYTLQDLSSYLEELLKVHGVRRIDAIHNANLNETFGYQIFKGQRNASRDKVLQLALGIGCTLQETQHLLIYANGGALYAKNRRDAIIIYGITHHLSLQAVEEDLYRFGEDTLSNDGI